MALKSRRHRSLAVSTGNSHACPSCFVRSNQPGNRCPSCQFTGGDTMAMFTSPPAQLLPILDAASLWSKKETKTIERRLVNLSHRYPQFRWCICSVHLPPEHRLRLFGFWLMNACPLAAEETAEQRQSTVLLAINATTHRVVAVPGYAAEPWLPDEGLQSAIEAMKPHWQNAEYGKAVCMFLDAATKLLDASWRKVDSLIRP